jgi:opacity protein-like surface antigen
MLENVHSKETLLLPSGFDRRRHGNRAGLSATSARLSFQCTCLTERKCVCFSMRIIFTTLFCSLLCTAPASAQSSIAGTSGETPVAAAPSKTPLAPIRNKTTVAAAKGKTIEMGLGYSYVSQAENQSKRVGLRGADASFTIGLSRLGIQADGGYALASNVLGTGQQSNVFSYLVGPVFHPTTHRPFDTYVHALVGGSRVSGPTLTNGGQILLGGWSFGHAWALGGGVEYRVTDSVAIRTGADYLRTAFYDSSLVVRGQSNFRTTMTVVYYFGRRSRR